MMDALFNLGSGVAVNYISNGLLQGLSDIKDKQELQSFKAALEDWALDFQRSHDGSIAARGSFADYVKNYHTVEAVIRYVILPDADGMDEQTFLKQIQHDMVQDLEEKLFRKLSPEDIEVVNCFLESLLIETKAFVTRRLPTQEQVLLYGLCQLQARDAKREKLLQEHFSLTEERISQLLEIVSANQNLLKGKTDLPREFDQLILNCNETLRKSQSKVKVYSWDDLPFDAVYIPPSLEANLDEQGTDLFWKCTYKNLIPWINESASSGKGVDANVWRCFFSEADLIHRQTDPVEKRRQQLNTLFDFSNIIYVIGGAGCGKSLFLQKLCANPEGLTGYKEKPLLIIRGDLKRMIQPDGMFKPMRRYLEECFVHTCLKEPSELSPNFLDRCLKAGRCLVLLDALDEVGNDQRNELHQRVISYFQDANPGNKVCITSRSRGFIPVRKITCFTICSITVENVGEYVDQFIRLEKFPQEERDRFIHQAASLVRKGFVTGFLTLSLLLAIYKNEQELPANKVSLYEKCFEYIANSREQRKKLLRNSSTGEEYDWGTLAKLMGEATFMHLACLGTPNNRDIPQEQVDDLMESLYKARFQSQVECRAATEMFLQFCADRTEVFVPSPNSNLEYRFWPDRKSCVKADKG